MPIYYFNLRGDTWINDPEGRECPNVLSAHAAAVTDLRASAAKAVLEGRLNLRERVEVTGEEGDVLFAVNARDVIAISY